MFSFRSPFIAMCAAIIGASVLVLSNAGAGARPPEPERPSPPPRTNGQACNTSITVGVGATCLSFREVGTGGEAVVTQHHTPQIYGTTYYQATVTGPGGVSKTGEVLHTSTSKEVTWTLPVGNAFNKGDKLCVSVKTGTMPDRLYGVVGLPACVIFATDAPKTPSTTTTSSPARNTSTTTSRPQEQRGKIVSNCPGQEIHRDPIKDGSEALGIVSVYYSNEGSGSNCAKFLLPDTVAGSATRWAKIAIEFQGQGSSEVADAGKFKDYAGGVVLDSSRSKCINVKYEVENKAGNKKSGTLANHFCN